MKKERIMTKEEILNTFLLANIPEIITQEEFDDVKKAIKELQQENQKYKEVIDKINNYIDNYDVFKVFSFPLMKRWEEEQIKSSIDYEFKSSLIKDLKDILKEVSE